MPTRKRPYRRVSTKSPSIPPRRSAARIERAAAKRARAAQSAIKSAGGVTKCWRSLMQVTDLHIERASLYGWLRRGVPPLWCIPLEKVSSVSRHILHPEVYPQPEDDSEGRAA